METPWTPYVTEKPLAFAFAMDPERYFRASYELHCGMLLGCRGYLQSNDVQTTNNGGATFEPVVPFDFATLVNVEKSQDPFLQIHPFAYPHLVASGLLNPFEASAMARITYQGTYGYSRPLERSFLAQFLGVGTIVLSFSTTFDLSFA